MSLTFFDDDAQHELSCPACGQPVERPDDMMQNLLVCLHCGHQFFIEIAPPDEIAVDDETAREELRRKVEAEQNRERDLDGMRIRALSTERRAMYRTRSFLIVAVFGCGFGIYLIVNELIHGQCTRLGQGAMVVLAIGCAMGIPFFGRKIASLQAELRKPVMSEPTEPPDFELLGDGSQTVRQLEEMHQAGEGENNPPVP